MSVKKELLKMYWGPVADPGPEPWIRWWEELTKEQRRVIIEKEINQRINQVRFGIDNLKVELEKLEMMKSMMKVKV